MGSVVTNDDYYNAIEQYLGVKKTELNNYLREEIKLEVTAR